MIEIDVEYRDSSGNIAKFKINLPVLSLVKHIAFVGKGKNHSTMKIISRILGVLLLYKDYLPKGNAKHFKIPSGYDNDPTETAQFSNFVGKGISDYLAKTISGAKITYCYEAAMRVKGIPIKGKRPDLLCDTGKEHFAVESKGYKVASISDKKMREVKKQSQVGIIPVAFSIASVTHGIYTRVKVKYYDPRESEYTYDRQLGIQLMKDYYRAVLRLLDRGECEGMTYKGEEYYRVKLIFEGCIGVSLNSNISILINKRVKEWYQCDSQSSLFEQKSTPRNDYT